MQVTIEQAMQIGREHRHAGRLGEAEGVYRQVLAQQPEHCEAWHKIGVVLYLEGKHEEAIAAFYRAIVLQPDFANAYYNLGVALTDRWRLDEAVAAFSRAIQLQPGFGWAHTNLGRALREQGKLDEAIIALSRGIELNPDSAIAHSNLGRVLKDQGRLDEALACHDRAMGLEPGNPVPHSSRVYTLHFHPGYDAAAILAEHRCWDQRHAEPFKPQIRPHPNDPSPGRRLKIGYVSPDFCLHPVGKFLRPLLANHDHAAFEMFCYSDVRTPDGLTGSLRAAADVWRGAIGMSDEQLAELIRQDRIDILIDLTMHMSGNRLLVFARKPAPVQVTYLAYPATTGLEAMDYRLTDVYLDPPGDQDADYDSHYTEQSIRLPDYFACYDPVAMTAAGHSVAPLPALNNGFVTFGCLNNFCKVNDGVLRLWARVLAAVPGSRLLLHAEQGQHLQRITALLAQHGIESTRVEFIPRQPWEQYFQTYHRIDIGLDTFPYNGHTTSMDSMWMGVPVVTLVGRTAVGRAGWSQLCNLGLKDLAAQNEEQFVQVAVGLARDLGRLSQLRLELRDRMLASPLTDGRRLAKNIENAYRQMWEKWCSAR